MTPSVSIRLAGGIGGHLLGMRALSLLHDRQPLCRIVVYSDSASHPDAVRIAALSPFASEVIPVAPMPASEPESKSKAEFEAKPESEAEAVADSVIDASGDDLFTSVAIALRMPLFELLATRPVLALPDSMTREADRFLSRFQASSLVGVCFASDAPDTLTRFQPRIMDAIRTALDSGPPGAVALNFVTSGADVLSTLDPRIIPCIDLPIELVATLLARCRYFVGGDNGIKHLAWALDIPRTFFVTERPRRMEILRWMPDVHRMRQFDGTGR